MLKQRLITAAFLIVFVVSSILALPSHWLGLVFGVVMLIGAWEWSALQKCNHSLGRYLFVAVIAGCCVLAYLAHLQSPTLVYVLYALACIWWLVALAWILTYKGETGVSDSQRRNGMLIGLLVLVPAWLALVTIHSHSDNGPYLLFYLIVLIATADSGAYFAGRKFGKHKLAPMVSPGKTIEGAVGALVASVLVVFGAVLVFEMALVELFWFLPLSLIVVVFSIVGDLSESLFKRRAGAKDSGTILPGHGGVLDRIDSLTSGLPIFAVGLMVFGGGV